MIPPVPVIVVATVAGAALAKTTGVRINLDVAAFMAALAGIVAGSVGYWRLKADRPKIVAEVADIQQLRLERALKAAWDNSERLDEEVKELRAKGCELEARLERALRAIDLLTHSLESAGLEAPDLPAV